MWITRPFLFPCYCVWVLVSLLYGQLGSVCVQTNKTEDGGRIRWACDPNFNGCTAKQRIISPWCIISPPPLFRSKFLYRCRMLVYGIFVYKPTMQYKPTPLFRAGVWEIAHGLIIQLYTWKCSIPGRDKHGGSRQHALMCKVWMTLYAVPAGRKNYIYWPGSPQQIEVLQEFSLHLVTHNPETRLHAIGSSPADAQGINYPLTCSYQNLLGVQQTLYPTAGYYRAVKP